MKIKNKQIKAFTLIELLIVIAIVGILASIILVSLNSGRDRARDAAIMSSAESIMKAAQVASAVSGDYTAWKMGSSGAGIWLNSEAECDTQISAGLLNSDQIISACKEIIKNAGTTVTGAAGNKFKFFIGSAFGPVYPKAPKLSVIAVLPGAQKVYCIGSNGGASKDTNLDMSGCPNNIYGSSWTCSGCAYDINGGN